MSETVVSWVVEFQRPDAGDRWLTWPGGPDEAGARRALDERRQARHYGRTRTRYRLVRRTAVVTDEVLEVLDA